jgi:Family of unknown function (DUF7019)
MRQPQAKPAARRRAGGQRDRSVESHGTEKLTDMEKFYLDARMRNFLYRSGSKIPMLYEQIDVPVRKRIAASLKIKLPSLAEAEFRQTERSPSYHDMLRMVLRHLDDAEMIGTVQEPRAYFAGRLDLRWYWEGDFDEDDFGYLGGREGDTVLSLSFSMRHLTHPPDEPGPPRRGVDPSASIRAGADERLRRLMGEGGAEIQSSDTLQWTFMLTASTMGPIENIEFVARRLRAEAFRPVRRGLEVNPEYADLRKRNKVFVVLGSPLYLASGD